MLIKKNHVPTAEEIDPMGGRGHLLLEVVSGAIPLDARIETLARATLAPGAAVGYHVHESDAEAYYFLSGVGEYNDGEKSYRVEAGDVTYTPIGEGHGVENVGDADLVFLALSVVSY